MAGPTLVNVGGVVNPYQDLQNAVSGVGQIYRGYEEDARKKAVFQAQEDERNRVKSMREFATGYDARVGDDFRGVATDIQPLAQQAEAQAMQRWRSTNPTATAEQQTAFETELKNARRSLASAEDVAASVSQDYMKAGFAPEEAEAYGRQVAVGYSARGAALANAQSQAKEYNDALYRRLKNAIDLAKLDSSSADARVGAIGRFAAASNGSNKAAGNSAKRSNTSSIDVFDPADATAAQKFFKPVIGSSDARAATVNLMAGLSQYNADQERKGLPKLSSKEATAIALGDINLRSILNSDVRYQSPEDVKVLLEQKQAAANARANEAKGEVSKGTKPDESKGDMSIQDYRDLVASQGGGVPNGLRDAILNPAYMAVSYDQVNRQRVASAYARLFPEAAKENGVVIPNSTPASTARTTTTNRKVAAPIDRSTAKPLSDLKVIGSGQVDLGEGNTKETPAGSTASPARPETTPARALAEEIVAYQNSGTNGDIDLPRVLQTLRVRNPDMYNSVMREKSDIDNLDRQLVPLEAGVNNLSTRLGNQNMMALSTDAGTPKVFTGTYGSVTVPTDSSYTTFLKDQEKLRVMQQQLEALRQRKPVTDPNKPQDFTRLRSILVN